MSFWRSLFPSWSQMERNEKALRIRLARTQRDLARLKGNSTEANYHQFSAQVLFLTTYLR